VGTEDRKSNGSGGGALAASSFLHSSTTVTPWADQAMAVLILPQSVFLDVEWQNVHLVPVGDRVAPHMTDLSKIFAMFRIEVETKCFSGTEDVLADRTSRSHRSKYKHVGHVGKRHTERRSSYIPL